MKNRMFFLSALALILFTGFCVTAQAQERRGLKVSAFGIGAASTDFKEAIQDSPDGDLWNQWSLTFGHYNYRVNLNSPLSLGLYTGSQLDIVFPSSFKFKPDEYTLVIPKLSLDVLQIGLAGGIMIADGIGLVAHVGAGLTTTLTMVNFDSPSYEVNVMNLGYGITPNVGVRAALSERFTLGLSYRMGEATTFLYVDGDKTGDSFKTDVGGFFLTISL